MNKLLASIVLLLAPSLALAQTWGDHRTRCTVMGDSSNNAAICYDTTNDLLWHDADSDNTWDAGEQILIHRTHATDCTSLNDGRNGDICLEADANAIYVCETADQCDGDEWTAYGGAADTTCDTGDQTCTLDDETITSGSNITLAQSASPTPTAEGRIEWDTDDLIVIGDGVGQAVFYPNAHTTDTGPSPDCSGTTTYQDGEGGCDDISLVYLALSGGTLTGELTADELGIEFQETDSLTDCSTFAATGGGIFYDDSEGILKKCQDNVLTDLDTTGGAGVWTDADPVLLNTTTRSVVIGTGQVNTSKLTVDGDANEVQVTIQGNATQSVDLLVLEQSDETEVLTVDNNGAIAAGAASFSSLAIDPSATPSIVLKDSDTMATPDDNIVFEGNCTGGDGTEDCILDIGVQGDGTRLDLIKLTGDTTSHVRIGNPDGADYIQITEAGALSSAGTGSVTADLINSSVAPTPTTDGAIEWESDDDHIIGGDGVDQVEFVPTEDVSGDILMTIAGVTTIQANSVALTTDTTGNYVASITNGAGITGGDGGSEGAALTLAATLGTSVDLTAEVTGTLPVANGGTGVTSSTGTTNVVLSNSPTIVTPTIASFTNATHDHTDAAGGGTIPSSAITTEVRSMYWGAGAMSPDGTQCADPTEVTINSGPITWTSVCTDNDGSTLYGHTVMPDGWNAGTVTFELEYLQTAADTSALNSDIAAMCRGAAETVNNTWGSEIAIDDAAVTGSNAVDHTTSAAVTANGTCAAGDTLFWRWQLDATGTTTAVATLHILGMKMEYTTNVGD